MNKKSAFPALRYLLPAVLFIGLAVVFLLGLNRNPNEIPSPLIGKPAPDFQLPVLSNVPATQGGLQHPLQTTADASGAAALGSEQFRGQPYLLNVWASWCMPCLQEHPQFLALARSQRIRLVGMNYKDKPEDARAWLRRHGNPYDEIIADTRGRVGIDFGVYGVPETFLIDGEGQIRFKHVGVVSPEVLQKQLLPAIAALEKPVR